MEPRKNESQKEHGARQEERKRRFQIVKLEERIAPSCLYRYNKQGKLIGQGQLHHCP